MEWKFNGRKKNMVYHKDQYLPSSFNIFICEYFDNIDIDRHAKLYHTFCISLASRKNN